jgi:hypothetical protein
MIRRPSRVRPEKVLTLPNIPDSILINKLVEMGQPRPHATIAMDSPQLKAAATIFYFDCLDAEKGDKEAKHRVEYVRDQWDRMRRAARALGEDPDRPNPRRQIHIPKTGEPING